MVPRPGPESAPGAAGSTRPLQSRCVTSQHGRGSGAWRVLRACAGIAAAVLALAFLLSVICPRRGEKEKTGGGPVEPAAAGVAPAAAPPSPAAAELDHGREAAGARDPTPAPAPSFDLLVEVRDAASGLPLPGAEVFLRRRDADGAPLALARATDAAGSLALPGLGRGAYALSARCRGYFDARDPEEVVIPTASPRRLLALRPAALILGRLVGQDGKPASLGLVRIGDAGGTVHDVRPGPDGAFCSPPLAAGTWRVEWREHVHAPADPRLRLGVAVAAGQECRLEITLEIAGGAGALPGRTVGIAVQP